MENGCFATDKKDEMDKMRKMNNSPTPALHQGEGVDCFGLRPRNDVLPLSFRRGVRGEDVAARHCERSEARHCERSEAIQRSGVKRPLWIASRLVPRRSQ